MNKHFVAVFALALCCAAQAFAGVEITGAKWQAAVNEKGGKAKFADTDTLSIGKKIRQRIPVRLVLTLSNTCPSAVEGIIIHASFGVKLSTSPSSEGIDAVAFAVDEVRVPKIKQGQTAEAVVIVRDLDTALRRAAAGGLTVQALRAEAMVAPHRAGGELPKVYKAALNITQKED